MEEKADFENSIAKQDMNKNVGETSEHQMCEIGICDSIDIKVKEAKVSIDDADVIIDSTMVSDGSFKGIQGNNKITHIEEPINDEEHTKQVDGNIENLENKNQGKEDKKRKKRFIIKAQTEGYKPINKICPEYNVIKQSLITIFSGKHEYKLLIGKNVYDKLCSHIDWGRNTSKNQNEQGGVLLGDVYIDPETNIIWGVVNNIVPAINAYGTSAYLQMDHKTWKEIIDTIDRQYSIDNHDKAHIIGWYHTHPKNLAVFMSGTDMDTQKSFFSKDWKYSIVINPQREEWSVYHGANAIECSGYVVDEININNENTKKSSDLYSKQNDILESYEEKTCNDENVHKKHRKAFSTIVGVAIFVGIGMGAIVSYYGISTNNIKAPLRNIYRNITTETQALKTINHLCKEQKNHQKEIPEMCQFFFV